MYFPAALCWDPERGKKPSRRSTLAQPLGRSCGADTLVHRRCLSVFRNLLAQPTFGLHGNRSP
jgi:hypothetical protein